MFEHFISQLWTLHLNMLISLNFPPIPGIWGLDRKGKTTTEVNAKKRTKKLLKESTMKTSNTSSNMGM